MMFRRFPLILGLLFISLFLLTACNGKPAASSTPLPTQTAAPAAAATPAPSATLAPTSTETPSHAGPTSTRTPTIARTLPPMMDRTVTKTLTQIPAATPTSTPAPDPLWFVHSLKIPEWPTELSRPWWEDQNTIKIDIYDGYRVVDVGEISISTPHEPVMPTFLQDAEEYSYV